MHPTQFSAESVLHPHNFDAGCSRQNFFSSAPTRFNVHDIDKHSIDNFLAGMEYKALESLVGRACAKAKDDRPKEWREEKLKAVFERHGIEYSPVSSVGLKSRKSKAVMNLMLRLQANSSQPGEKDRRPLFERFCALLQDAHSVFSGGQHLLITEIGKSIVASASSPKADAMPMTKDGVASAMPACQSEEIVIRLARVNSCINRQLEAAKVLDLDDPQLSISLTWLRGELAFISCQPGLSDFLKEQLHTAANSLDKLEQMQQHREAFIIKKCYEMLNDLENTQKEAAQDTEYASKSQEFSHELEHVVNQFVETLACQQPDGRYDLLSRVQALEERMSVWNDCVKAGERLARLTEKISAIDTHTSSQDLNSLSEKLIELKDTLNDLPFGERQARLLKQFGRVHEQFFGKITKHQPPLSSHEAVAQPGTSLARAGEVSPTCSSELRNSGGINNDPGRMPSEDYKAVLSRLSSLLGQLSMASEGCKSGNLRKT